MIFLLRIFPFHLHDQAELLHETLEELFLQEASLFPKNIKGKEDIRSNYQCFRSYRRASATRANDENVPDKDINAINRWRVKDRAQGSKVNLPMQQHYAQYLLLENQFIRYTTAM